MPSSSRLWTPDGEVSVNREMVAIDRRTLQMLADLHEFAHHYRISLLCQHCNQPLSGANNDGTTATGASVRCGCREWRFTSR